MVQNFNSLHHKKFQIKIVKLIWQFPYSIRSSIVSQAPLVTGTHSCPHTGAIEVCAVLQNTTHSGNSKPKSVSHSPGGWGSKIRDNLLCPLMAEGQR